MCNCEFTGLASARSSHTHGAFQMVHFYDIIVGATIRCLMLVKLTSRSTTPSLFARQYIPHTAVLPLRFFCMSSWLLLFYYRYHILTEPSRAVSGSCPSGL